MSATFEPETLCTAAAAENIKNAKYTYTVGKEMQEYIYLFTNTRRYIKLKNLFVIII